MFERYLNECTKESDQTVGAGLCGLAACQGRPSPVASQQQDRPGEELDRQTIRRHAADGTQV